MMKSIECSNFAKWWQKAVFLLVCLPHCHWLSLDRVTSSFIYANFFVIVKLAHNALQADLFCGDLFFKDVLQFSLYHCKNCLLHSIFVHVLYFQF